MERVRRSLILTRPPMCCILLWSSERYVSENAIKFHLCDEMFRPRTKGEVPGHPQLAKARDGRCPLRKVYVYSACQNYAPRLFWWLDSKRIAFNMKLMKCKVAGFCDLRKDCRWYDQQDMNSSSRLFTMMLKIYLFLYKDLGLRKPFKPHEKLMTPGIAMYNVWTHRIWSRFNEGLRCQTAIYNTGISLEEYEYQSSPSETWTWTPSGARSKTQDAKLECDLKSR